MGILKKLFGGGQQNDEPQPEIEDVSMHFPKSDDEIAFLKTNVAGCNFRLKMSDARKPYQGNAVPEPTNPQNPKAIALISDDGKQLGYVPDDRLREYYDIFKGRNPRFYGAIGIFKNDSGKKMLFGKVMLVDVPEGDDGTLQAYAQKQLDYMMEKFKTE